MNEERKPSETMGPEPSTPQYSSLRDYVRVLRRHRALILLITVAFGAGALIWSLAQSDKYRATASLSFRDPLADLRVIGPDVPPEDSPPIRAAASAELITRPEVARRAARILDRDPAEGRALAARVSAQVAPQTNFVLVTAEADSGPEAAAITNAFARAAEDFAAREIENRLESARDSVLRELREARRDETAAARPLEIQTLQIRLNTISALQDIAQPVSINRSAGVPAEPFAPQPERNAVIGLLVGLLVGVVVAFGRDALDRRFRTVHDVHAAYQLPVLARVAGSAFGHAGLVAGPGLPMSDADFEAFRVLRTNLGYLENGGPLRTVLITSGMPEEGKTAVSMALASAAAYGGARTLLVECDLRRPAFAKRLGVQPAPGLADYLRGDAGPGDAVQTVEIGEPWSPSSQGRSGGRGGQFACITAGSNPNDAVERLSGERFSRFLDSVSKAYDLVVLDASPLLAVVDPLTLMPLVDATLLCVRVQQSSAEEAKAVRSALEHLPERPLGLVVTGLNRGGPDSYEYYYGY